MVFYGLIIYFIIAFAVWLVPSNFWPWIIGVYVFWRVEVFMGIVTARLSSIEQLQIERGHDIERLKSAIGSVERSISSLAGDSETKPRLVRL